MKILHVIPSVSPVRGGPSQAVIEMIKSLQNRGIEASIVTTNDDGPNLLDVATDGWVEYHGISVRFFPRFSPNVKSIKEFSFSSALTAWLWKNIKKYDLVHVHAVFSYPSTVTMAIARNQGVPYIVRPLGQLCKWSLQQSKIKKKLYLNIVERANLNKSKGIHLTSKQEQQEASQLQLTCPSFIVPHGLDLTPPIQNARKQLRLKLKLPKDETIILFLSRIHPKKGLDYLIFALGNLVNYPFTFILAGNGEPAYEAEVQTLLQKAGIRQRTVLSGFVEGEAKALLLQGADLFALTSHSENFGVAVLEGLAAGLPALVTPGVALSTEIKRHGLGYVPELESAAITSALEKCLRNPAHTRQLGEHAQRFTSEHYTWRKNAEKLIETYRNVLS